MQWSDISFTPPTRTLRQFAGTWVVFFGALAVWHGLREDHRRAALVLAALAATVGPLGLVWPAAVRWLYVGGMVVTFPVGWLVSRAVLAVAFFGIITPLALVFRLAGRDLLRLRRPAGRDTYWTAKPAAADTRRYFRPF